MVNAPYIWSTTPANNGTADSSAQFPEGQAPSTVNDGARAIMSAIKKWFLDTSGSLVVAGGTTNYTLGTNQVFDSLAHMDGATLTFRMPSTCAASPTLNVDGLGAKNITYENVTALAAGTLQSGHVYSVVYVHATTNFALIGSGDAILNAPSGTKILMAGTTVPGGWTVDTTLNDALPRVLTSAPGGTAGSVAFSTFFANPYSLTAFTILQGNLPNVSFTGSASVSGGSLSGSVGVSSQYAPGSAGSGTVGNSGSTSLTLTDTRTWSASVSSGGSGTAITPQGNFAVQYVNSFFALKS